MMQTLSTTASGQMESAGTSVTTCTSVPARLIHLQADSANSGTVTITSLGGTYGIVLSAGDIAPPIWLENLDKIAYKASASGQKLNYVVYR